MGHWPWGPKLVSFNSRTSKAAGNSVTKGTNDPTWGFSWEPSGFGGVEGVESKISWGQWIKVTGLIFGGAGTGCEINGDLLDWPGTCETSFLRDGNLEEQLKIIVGGVRMASVESYLKTGTFHFPTPSPVRVTSCPLGPAQPQGESCLLLVPWVNRPAVFLELNFGWTSIENGGPIQKNVESSPELFFFFFFFN